MGHGGAARRLLVGDQGRVAPQRLTVAAPVERERPARQLLARVPFALPIVDQPARCEPRLQPLDQVVGPAALERTHRLGVPLGPFAVVDRDEGRLAADRQPDVALDQTLVDLMARRQDLLPLLLAVGLGHPRLLEDAAHAHRHVELDLAGIDGPGDRCRGLRVGGAGEGNVALVGEQPRGRIEADPAGTRQVDLGPGVKIGEVLLGAGRAVERLHVGLELDQVAGDEAGGQAQVAQDLHQQPSRIAARARAQAKRLLAGLDAGFHADHVADVALQALVEADQEVDDRRARPSNLRQPGTEVRPYRLALEVGGKVLRQRRLVDERERFRFRLDEEVERVERRHFGHEIDLDPQRLGLLGEHEAGKVVAERILLPVEEMLGRLDLERVAENLGPAMGRRAQANDLGCQADQPIVPVNGPMVQRDVHDHGLSAPRCSCA